MNDMIQEKRTEEDFQVNLVCLTRENLPEEAFKWATVIHAQNVKKGWWPDGVRGRDLVETLLLIKSELIEAFEEHRKPDSSPSRVYKVPGSEKPEGIPIEIADDAIRTLDLMGALCSEYELTVTPSAWKFGSDFKVAESMAHAIDNEINALGILRIRFELELKMSPQTAHSYFVDELACHLVRLFRFAEAKGFDLGVAIEIKHRYNATRAFRHGNKKA